MAYHRGHPAQLLVRLGLETSDATGAISGTIILRDGRPVGHLTTVAPVARRALGYVRHARAKSGETFELEGGGQVHVMEPEPERRTDA